MAQPQAGIFHGGTIIAVDKCSAGQGLELLHALRGSPWLSKARLLVLVDAWQDPSDYAGVYWRVMNNVDWQRDMVIEADGLGIDATRKLPGELMGSEVRQPLQSNQEVEQMVSRRWTDYGFKTK
jgi:3-polyprenyl-4-hydroxybenzoate decarboxylase